ncbi:MAG: cytochrome b N-terminal domain-containing protein [Thermaerobacter sp.]|nr:cytochrome b N-terminal domain-containing protein [Thermaerobacter sp.]
MSTGKRNWTVSMREKSAELFSLDTWLPTELPEYATGFMYTLGSLTASSFVILLISGIIMAANGPQWWTISALGFFLRGVHFWSVQAFFFFMILHLLRVFFSGAWRGGRERTWLLGTLALLIAIPTAFTGYLVRGDFYSQWNAVQAKDGLNALGLAWFNTLNAGQMYGLHVIVFPFILGGIIAMHIAMIRIKGVVPPYPSDRERAAQLHEEGGRSHVPSAH